MENKDITSVLDRWEAEAKESVYAVGYQRDFSRLEDRIIRLIEIIRKKDGALKNSCMCGEFVGGYEVKECYSCEALKIESELE